MRVLKLQIMIELYQRLSSLVMLNWRAWWLFSYVLVIKNTSLLGASINPIWRFAQAL
jgi:hypothetical protein